MTASYCQYIECGDAFYPTESSDGEFCSYSCEEMQHALEDGYFDQMELDVPDQVSREDTGKGL